MTDAYVEALLDGAATLHIPMTPVLAERLHQHHQLVVKWAQKMNLTTVTTPELAARRHGLDCLLFAQMIPEDAEATVVDVGSGAGFPGIVLAMARPRLHLVLLEPIRKRASFLRIARAELGLDRVQVVEGRLTPEQPSSQVSWPVPWIVSRATIPVLDLIPLASGALGRAGQLICSAGSGAPSLAAVVEAAAQSRMEHVTRSTFVLPGGESRVLDRFHKVD